MKFTAAAMGVIMAIEVGLASACQGTAPNAASPAVVNVPPVDASALRDEPLVDSIPPAPSASAAASEEGRCPGACMGGASADLVRSIATRAAQARRCYNSQLVKTPTARGSMRITMRLDPDGQVCTAHVTASELPREMDDCVLSLLEAAAYVAPTGGCLDVNLPLQFQPMVAEAGTP